VVYKTITFWQRLGVRRGSQETVHQANNPELKMRITGGGRHKGEADNRREGKDPVSSPDKRTIELRRMDRELGCWGGPRGKGMGESNKGGGGRRDKKR